MDKHCNNCVHHHNAGHKKPKKELIKFNNWCCVKGAAVDIGHCKTMGLKRERERGK